MNRLKHNAVALGIAMAISGTANADLDDGLVAYYPFNGNAHDESENGNHGIVNGAILTNDRFGHSNAAYNFDGVDDCISISSIPLNSSNFNSTEATLTAWFKVNELDASLAGYLVNFSNTNNTDFAALNYRPDAHVLSSTRGASFGDYFEVSQAITTSGWHFVASTYVAGEARLYVDGQQIDRVSGFNVSGINALLIGCDQNRGGADASSTGRENFFDSSIDDVSIYNRALSKSEIGELYQLGSKPTKTYEDGLNEGIAKCQNDPASCGITVPPESGNCPSVDTHASFSPSDGVLTIPAVDVPDIFGGVTTYRAEMSLEDGEGLVFSVTKAEPVQ